MALSKDNFYMKKALSLAKNGEGTTSPNPHVGAIIVKNDEIISTGYHRKAGEPHAEAIAIEKAGEKASGATIYVNLEPCNHYGRTPPCTEKIIKAGIKRVVIGMKDPNPLATGGIKRLKSAGIEVKVGVLEKESRFLNRHFIHWVKNNMPWVSIKVALTLDGKMATLSGNSKWITGEEARKDVHKWRKTLDVIIVGINTVLKDDPELTVRMIKSNHQPVRAVIDPDLKIPLSAKILNNKSRSIVFHCQPESNEKINQIKELGHLPVAVKECRDKINISEILNFMAGTGYIKIGVEGGSYLISEFVKNGFANEFFIYYAPILLGEGIEMIKGINPETISEGLRLIRYKVKKFKSGDTMLHLFSEKSFKEVFE